MDDYDTIKRQFKVIFGAEASIVAVGDGRFKASLPAFIVGPEEGAQRPLEAFAASAEDAETNLVSLVLDVASKDALETSSGLSVGLYASKEDLHLTVG